MDDALRTALWNIVLARLFGKVGANQYGEISQEYHLFINLQRNFFALPMDELEKHLGSRREWYKDVFMTMEWWRVYDFVEFVARRMIPYDATEWERDVNEAFAAQRAGNTLAGGSVVPFEGDGAVAALGEALSLLEAHEVSPAHRYVKSALAALALRPEADAAQAIAHARAAVGTAACYVMGRPFPQATALSAQIDDASQAALDDALAAALDDATLALPTAFVTVGRALFLQPEANHARSTSERTTEAQALVSFASGFVALLVHRGVAAGKVPERERVTHRPTPPDPWGERKLVRPQG